MTGLRNPDWTFEETILALELYFGRRPTLPDEHDTEVIRLSGLLQLMAKEDGVQGNSSFRNPAGVAMKIANLSRLDSTGRKGLSHGSKVEEAVWIKYQNDPQALKSDAQRLRSRIAQELIEPDLAKPSPGTAGTVTASPEAEPRIWITGMWGFTPDIHGYVGFTNEGPRAKYIENCLPGDLMLVIGQNGETADPRDVGRLLGLVELEPSPVDETECMSPDAYIEKKRLFGPDRWRHAMPVVKAWKLTREVKARDILPTTCDPRNARTIGASCLMLTDSEVRALLRLPTRPSAVWGQSDWNEYAAQAEEELRGSEAIRRGPKPFFGSVGYQRSDGITYLYVMKLHGPLDRLYGSSLPAGNVPIKFGISNDLSRRECELNWGLPPKSGLKWQVHMKQKFRNADDAYEAEGALLNLLVAKCYSCGDEFAIVPAREIGSLVAAVSRSSAFLISA